jgi:hypothetical protein
VEGLVLKGSRGHLLRVQQRLKSKGNPKFAGANPEKKQRTEGGYGEEEKFHGVNVGQARCE